MIGSFSISIFHILDEDKHNDRIIIDKMSLSFIYLCLQHLKNELVCLLYIFSVYGVLFVKILIIKLFIYL
jgi:hypothetical protein